MKSVRKYVSIHNFFQIQTSVYLTLIYLPWPAGEVLIKVQRWVALAGGNYWSGLWVCSCGSGLCSLRAGRQTDDSPYLITTKNTNGEGLQMTMAIVKLIVSLSMRTVKLVLWSICVFTLIWSNHHLTVYKMLLIFALQQIFCMFQN